jgi:hypothetical protein
MPWEAEMTTQPANDDEVPPPFPVCFGKQGEWIGLTEDEAMLLNEYQFAIYQDVHRSCLVVEAAERKLRDATSDLHRLVAAQRAVETQLLAIPKITHTDLVRQLIADRFA